MWIFFKKDMISSLNKTLALKMNERVSFWSVLESCICYAWHFWTIIQLIAHYCLSLSKICNVVLQGILGWHMSLITYCNIKWILKRQQNNTLPTIPKMYPIPLKFWVLIIDPNEVSKVLVGRWWKWLKSNFFKDSKF